MTDYTLVGNLSEVLEGIQPDSIISRTFYKGESLKAIAFGFDAGQALTEHTSSRTAVIHIIEGEAVVTLGDDRYELKAGAWVYMPPNLKHSVHAVTQVVMLLTMIES
jgi:quercetin dioxygenase-like cupin family protein